MTGKGIVPKSKAKGVDMCGRLGLHYIIRSDLGLFMQVRDLHKGEDISVRKLHPSCQGGDHYFADDNWFYIIKGDSCRKVKDLETDSSAEVIDVPAEFKIGDHYFGGLKSISHFFITQENQRLYIIDNIAKPETPVSITLILKDGLYYWMVLQRLYFLEYHEKWGVQFSYSQTINFARVNKTYSMHPSVVNFLPGGLSLSYGPANGTWQMIKHIANDTPSTLKSSTAIKRVVGYNKEKMSSLSNSWNVAVGSEVSVLAAQFSLSAEYGGSSENTSSESWEEATEIEDAYEFELEPRTERFVWQYKMKLGNEDILYGQRMYFTDSAEPPKNSPLSAA